MKQDDLMFSGVSSNEMLAQEAQLYTEMSMQGFDMDFDPSQYMMMPGMEQFGPQFLDCNRDSFLQSTKKRPKWEAEGEDDDKSSDSMLIPTEDLSGLSPAEIKRQIHIQSEQKRRAQIRDGFEELRQHLPQPLAGSNSKQPSKAAILSRTVLHLQHLKATQHALLVEIDRLRIENGHLKYAQLMQAQQDPNDKQFSSLYSIGM
ncbi:hypothetical protein DSO57_1026385 [Entomophthora muscae]|uniref:Uncharacterized protein n=2 Tax=Entomophthora muscae TaxID=34485 RepID=A0ACC2RDI8_9FUNG|nr:hypothetical protein DSO57_1038136 [Entomophthora muscae]KAJ9064808.1 hypothetical protein DSO57_1026385 [Entomophthora muscae]